MLSLYLLVAVEVFNEGYRAGKQSMCCDVDEASAAFSLAVDI